MLTPTPPDKLCDAQGRPYFLWDVDLTLAAFLERLRGPGDERDYRLATLLRQAKPDDALTFVDLATIREARPRIGTRLGHMGPFWAWRVAKGDHG